MEPRHIPAHLQSTWNELMQRLQEINHLRRAANVLIWDQNTYMPPGGAAARGRHQATLNRLAHAKFIDPALGRLLDTLEPLREELPPDSDEASILFWIRREYDRARRVPESFVARATAHFSRLFQVWTEARPRDDWQAVRPLLEESLRLSQELAAFFPEYQEPLDVFIDHSDPGMTAARMDELFQELRGFLRPMVQAIAAQPPVDDSCLRQHYPVEGQRTFGEMVAACYGYDFRRGRQDLAPHPFMIKIAQGDVRITTRYREDDLAIGLFSTLHETGHALYEQNIHPRLADTPLDHGVSAGVHESQSRLWENLVGRSRPFWEHFYPRLQETFPEQLGQVSLETFYRAINKVQPSLIRTEADEVTYNLHIMLRFDLERAMLNQELQVADLPEAWRARMAEDLGVEPSNHRDGVLQDIHWFSGFIGGSFQGYTLGNIMGAQFFQAAMAERGPDIQAEMAQGRFDALRTWLTEQIYQHGGKFLPDTLIERVTGRPLSVQPYLEYLQRKYSELYDLSTVQAGTPGD